MNPQEDSTDSVPAEHAAYLRSQLITYIGNKRALLPFVEAGIAHAKDCLGKTRIDFLDLFESQLASGVLLVGWIQNL